MCWLLALSCAMETDAKTLPKILVSKDGRGFVTEKRKPFVPFGVSYYRPGTGWAPQVWKKFDAAATRQDFARMKELGVNCVRVFLSYGSFYHQLGMLDTNGLAKFDQFLDIAERAGIYVHPTGPDLWEGPPEWPLGGIDDEKTLSALETYWKMFAARYRGRKVIFAYDLRNEPAVGWQVGTNPAPPRTDALTNSTLLDFQSFRERQAENWTRRQSAAIKSVDPKALVTIGLVQWSVPSLLPGDVGNYSAFRPRRVAPYLDFLTIHFYPLEEGGYKYDGAASEAKQLAYLEGVVRESAVKGRPLVLGEFGWYGGNEKPKFNGGEFPPASEEEQAQYDRKVIETTAGLVCGWLNWGFYDQPEANDCSELTGLVRADGQVKAWGRAFQSLAARFRGHAIPPKKMGPRPALDWDACLTSMAAETKFRQNYFNAFRADH